MKQAAHFLPESQAHVLRASKQDRSARRVSLRIQGALSLSLSNARRRNHARRGEEAQGARAGGSNCLYWPTGASSCKPVAAERFALGFLQLRFCHLALKGVLSRVVWNRTRRLRPSKGFALDPPVVESLACKSCSSVLLTLSLHEA